ncbi:MAG: lysophospholipid acyltransferase family protein [Myxococcota bacterium]|nr:lysophospholipid acyltransferase family protein [Myxococcota bacterium]
MLRASLSLLFWAFLVLSSTLFFGVALALWAITAPFDRRRVVLHGFTCFWASVYTWLNPAWKVRVLGRERIRPGVAYIMVANHLSLLDILVVFRLFRHFKWVSKIENFRVPLIGWNMTLNGYIPLRRGSQESAAHMLEACEHTLEAGSSVTIFPEGTRSSDGRLLQFRPGAFEIAKRAQQPILPVLIRGTADALPKRGFILRGRHPISVEVLDELAPESFSGLDTEQLALEVRQIFAERLGEDGQNEPIRAAG